MTRALVRGNLDFAELKAGSGGACLVDSSGAKIWRLRGVSCWISARFTTERSSGKLLPRGGGKILLSPQVYHKFGNLVMEMLVAVARHRNYGSRGKSQVSDGFITSPSSGFRSINCRTFQSGVGILPAPSHGLASFASPRPTKQRPSPFYSEPPKQPRRSSPISISPRPVMKGTSLNYELYDSERWAGPAYSNSPPPSSLPMPKFSLHQKRSVSLELSGPKSGIEIQPLARSAPPSPTRDLRSSPSDFFFNIDSATQDLRRILHLDVSDD